MTRVEETIDGVADRAFAEKSPQTRRIATQRSHRHRPRIGPSIRVR
jgi:hypothetical protein